MTARRAVTAAMLLLALAPTGALASAKDVAATHAYIQANYSLTNASVGLISRGQSKIEAFNSKLASECPLVGKGTPEDETSQPMSYEVAVALWAISYGTVAAPIAKFVAAVKPLHWSNQRITAIAHTYATSLHLMSTLSVPDLCAEVRAWKASGFHTVPSQVSQTDSSWEAIEGESVPRKLLAPYERGSDASLAARARSFEVKLAETEFMVGQDDWIQVLETLGLPE
ncbi:MAG TPA: hypothetical protein VGX51_02625 [Solirubrobacteraceae bacterium]|nr:hypothetical protein [Solirubrobacteraceae bacterium]